jgi:hypothetical protein
MPFVDGLVALAAEQLVGLVVAERRHRGGIDEADHAVVIEDAERLRGGLEYGAEELLGIDVRACEVGEAA